MDSTFFNNLINFPNVNFDLVLFYILHLTSFANRITGWYFGVGEGRVYATGVPSAGINFALKIRMPYNRQTRQFSCSTKVQQSIASVPSKQDKFKMNPWFVTGFTDG